MTLLHAMEDRDAKLGLVSLCLGGGDLTTEAGQRAGLLRYNQSIPYGSLVLAEGRGYRDALELPDIPPRPDDAD